MKFVFFSGLLMVVLFTACTKSSPSSPPDPVTSPDSATLTVVNGYGSGTYKIGDTVNIWSQAIADNSIFDSWTGLTDLMQNSGEWHNTFIMPAKNVTVTATTKSLPAYTLKYEKIQGMNIQKNVYYYFPPAQKGMVYLLHGTNGSAQNIVNNFDWIQMIKDLVYAGYGIVVTEAEEVSLGTDLNSDGVYRWKLTPQDSATNPDYANFKALRDTFYKRGYTSPAIPQFSIGMSAGGAYSCTLSAMYKFKSGVSYCAPGFQIVFNTSVTPFMFAMAKYDDNDEVGAQGNADALTYYNLLTGRGICSKHFVQDKSPVYPERFARRSDISVATSIAFYNELKVNGWLDNKNYLTAAADTLAPIFTANQTLYPTYNKFTIAQRLFVTDQLDEMYAAHHFFSDLNKTTIKFLDSQCN